jgi:carboxyl-terminal processing protease
MPRFNFYLLLFAVAAYTLTSGVTLRDRLLISTLHRIERSAYFEPSAKDLFEGAVSGMADVLSDEHGDGYSMYIPQSRKTQYQNNLANQYEGLGMLTRIHEEGEEKKLLIDFPFYDSPAYRAGLRSGDQILQIDGISVADKADHEVFQLLRQRNKLATHLVILPLGQTESKDVVVPREKIQYESVLGDYFGSDGQVFCLETHPKIGYIWIRSFSESTAKEFGHALDRMVQSGADAFILDLRDNGGGDVWNCVQVVQMLLSPDPVSGNVIVTIRDRNGMKRLRHRRFVLTEGTQRCFLPMVVLIDGETASASEILAAALQDHHRATIVGTRSFGKGIIQGIITLPFQSGILQLTDAEYRRPNGAAIHRKRDATESDDWGVLPDKIIELTEAERSAVIQYRSLRSGVISTKRSAVLDQFRQQIIKKQNEEEPDSEQKLFEFTGTAPYYDRQLDEAIKVLLP